MKYLLARGSAAALVAAAALTAACSNNDPMAPAAPNAARTPSNVMSAPHAYVGAGVAASASGNPSTGGASTTGGYAVSWAKGDQPNPSSGQQ